MNGKISVAKPANYGEKSLFGAGLAKKGIPKAVRFLTPMTSSRRVALSLTLVTTCGGVLLFSLSSAKGQNAAVSNAALSSAPGGSSLPPGSHPPPGIDPASGAATGATGTTSTAGATAGSGTGSPHFNQSIGISSVQTGNQASISSLVTFGGTGNEPPYDLQRDNIYSLLRQNGVLIPNVLHPYSTAKPSFIVERLIVLSLTGGTSTSTASAGGGQASLSAGGSGDAGATQTSSGPSGAQNTISEVKRYIDAEISQGSGRSGGAHRRKLQLMSDSIGLLLTANSVGSAISSAASSGPSGSGGGGGTSSKLDPREFLYGQVRLTSRKADLYVPVPSSY